jgi:hypothetical protein
MTKEELDKLAHGIAYDAACSVIESNCLHVDGCDISQGLDWFDTDPDSVDLDAEDHVAESVKYLEARGLIVRHKDNANWVQLQDESEATA